MISPPCSRLAKTRSTDPELAADIESRLHLTSDASFEAGLDCVIELSADMRAITIPASTKTPIPAISQVRRDRRAGAAAGTGAGRSRKRTISPTFGRYQHHLAEDGGPARSALPSPLRPAYGLLTGAAGRTGRREAAAGHRQCGRRFPASSLAGSDAGPLAAHRQRAGRTPC